MHAITNARIVIKERAAFETWQKRPDHLLQANLVKHKLLHRLLIRLIIPNH